MCHYNGVRVSRSEFIRLKEIEKELKLHLTMNKVNNGFNYPQWPVIRANPECAWEEVMMEWGYLPERVKTRKEAELFRKGYVMPNGKWQEGINTLNAKGEELMKPFKMYKQSGKERRCLVLSWGFFEWRHIFPLNKKTGLPLKTAKKYPYHISVKDHVPFFIAGIWTPWKDQETGEYVETFSLVTTEANELMKQVHNSKERMPTILTDELAGKWLSDDLTEDEITEIATYQFPAAAMEAYTINKDFVKENDPSPFDYEELPALILQ